MSNDKRLMAADEILFNVCEDMRVEIEDRTDLGPKTMRSLLDTVTAIESRWCSRAGAIMGGDIDGDKLRTLLHRMLQSNWMQSITPARAVEHILEHLDAGNLDAGEEE